MSASPRFPSPSSRSRAAAHAVRAIITVIASAVVALLLVDQAHAAGDATGGDPRDLILEGPHPFLRQNALSVNHLLGTAIGNSFSGQGIGINFGHMWDGPLWIDLQLNFRASTCPPWRSRACETYTGNDAELLAGAAWRFQLEIPVVPFVRANAGLVFLYPDGATSAVGIAARGGAGAKYYIFDWLGFGAEGALSLGRGFFASQYPGSRIYAVVDMVIGVEVQFH